MGVILILAMFFFSGQNEATLVRCSLVCKLNSNHLLFEPRDFSICYSFKENKYHVEGKILERKILRKKSKVLKLKVIDKQQIKDTKNFPPN